MGVMSDKPSTLQDFPYEAGIQAIKDSLDFSDFDDFYQHVLHSLPQNSPETRRRYASLLTRWFFPERKLGGLLPRTWAAYRDDALLQELVRVTTLETEPVIASFVTDIVYATPPGQAIDPAIARDYIIATYGSYKKNSYDRLIVTVRNLGFLARHENQWAVPWMPTPANGLLILLHARFARTPRIVRISDLLAAPFWRYLGYRGAEDVRATLRAAETAGLIARYSIVDELEQITTRYSFDDFLSNALRL
jgi:hypothetical protein